jgi:hypothetical protein
MTPGFRTLAFVLFAGSVLLATGCNTNARKLVGKWKMTSVGNEKEKDVGLGAGITFYIEFKSDGTGAASVEATDPKVQELVKMLNEKAPSFSWTVTGDALELTNTSKDAKAEGPFGKKEKAKLTIKFEGDNVTLTPEDKNEKSVTLTRVK